MTTFAEMPCSTRFRCTYWLFEDQRREPDTACADGTMYWFVPARFMCRFVSGSNCPITAWNHIIHDLPSFPITALGNIRSQMQDLALHTGIMEASPHVVNPRFWVEPATVFLMVYLTRLLYHTKDALFFLRG